MADKSKEAKIEDAEEELVQGVDGLSVTNDASDSEAAKKKKKRKKKKKKAATDEASSSTEPLSEEELKVAKEKQLMRQQLAAKITQLQAPPPQAEKKPEEKDFKFWKTQPVPQYGEETTDAEFIGALEPDDHHEIKQDPLKLPAGFEWTTVEVEKSEQLDELYDLLNENYVEDDDNMFRFDYSRDFLKWALQPPGWKPVWHVGVRGVKNGKLLAFISGIPAHMRMEAHSQLLVEINFLCVHKKLRSHRLAPVLIREITRRVNIEGTFQAVYTAGVVLPRPIAKCRYWHRSLDPKKLIDIKFSYLPRQMTMAKLIKQLRLPLKTVTPGIRKMVVADVPAACKITVQYLAQFKVAPVFNEADFAHWLLPRDGVIDSFVVEDPETKEITDMISFYTLPSTVCKHPLHTELKAAYSFYNVHTKTPIKQLMQDALSLAKHELNFDVFNALDLMKNSEFLQDLQFGGGDGHLQYYLYNYRMPHCDPEGIGLVLL